MVLLGELVVSHLQPLVRWDPGHVAGIVDHVVFALMGDDHEGFDAFIAQRLERVSCPSEPKDQRELLRMRQSRGDKRLPRSVFGTNMASGHVRSRNGNHRIWNVPSTD